MEIIAEVFSEVQDSTSVSSKQVYTLLEQYESNRSSFFRAMEQCYLKILKSMLKAPRKIIEKYEKLTEKLFETAYRQFAAKSEGQLHDETMILNANGVSKKHQRLGKKDVFALFQHFFAFFSRALDSTQLQIRVFSARIVFILLKLLPPETLVEVTEVRVARQLILGTLSLMKEKKGNLKQIGIKITSYLQRLMDRADLTTTAEAIALKSEMMRSMCMDDQDQIRKLALINLEMNDNTFPHLIKRIRDKNPEIRATVFKKLIKEQIPLVNLSLSDIYKLIYDGLGSREAPVRDACTRYLALNYCLFKEEAQEKVYLGSEIEVEDDKAAAATGTAGGEDENAENPRATRRMKRFFTPNKESGLKDMKIKILNFLQTFDIEKSLYYPELYESLEMLVKEAVKSIFDADGLAAYLKDAFVNQLSLKKKKKHTAISLEGEELFLIRIVCGMVQNPEERALLTPEIVAVVEDCFPNGIDFAQVLIYYAITTPSLFSLHQTLLTSEYLINCDEAGRNKLQETLKHLVVNMSNLQLISDIPQDPTNQYNDIFYELDPDTVKNNIFAQSYFQSPIITCCYELLPIIVRILKKVVSDGHVNVQLIQLISEVHEPLAKDADNDAHFDLPSDLERIQRSVKEDRNRLDILDKELTALKKNKTKQKEIYDLEKDREERLAHLKILLEKEEATSIKIFDISMRELILVQALLANCKVDPKDGAISNLLQQVIMPGLNSNDDNLVSHSLKALALFVLIDRNYCNDFFSVFQELLMKNEKCQITSPSEIISLRSIVDFILLYDLSRKSSEDEEDIDIPFTQELILRYAFQADTLLRTISIEGLSKLLFNGKLQDPQSMICLLMVIWFDTRICQKEGFKAVQILSTLFKTYSASSLQNLSVFERALELFSLLIVTLDKRGLVFNDEFVIFDHLNESFTSKALRVGINLMSYEYHKTTEALAGVNPLDFCPQERFFMFLAYKCSKDRRFQSLFEKVIPFFDFYSRCSQFQLTIILKFLHDAVDNCTNSKTLHGFEKQIQDRIRIEEQKRQASEGMDEETVANAVATAAATVNAAAASNEEMSLAELTAEKDAKLFTLNPRALLFCEKLCEQIENNLADMDVILKNLQDSSIIVQDTLEKRENRHRLIEEDEEDNGAATVEEDEEEDITPAPEKLEEDVRHRKTAVQRANRRKAAQKQRMQQAQLKGEQSEEDDEDNDIEDNSNEVPINENQKGKRATKSTAVVEQPKLRGRARGRVAQEAQKKQSSDSENDDDDSPSGSSEQPAKSQKKQQKVQQTRGRPGRKPKQQVQSSDDEEEHDEPENNDDDQMEEVEQAVVAPSKRKRGRQPAAAVKPAPAKKGKKQVEEEESSEEQDSDRIEEEEEEPEEKVQKVTRARGRSNRQAPATIKPRQSQRTAASKKARDQSENSNSQSSDDNNNSDEDNDDESEENQVQQPALRTSSRRKPAEKQQPTVITAAKKPVSSARRARRN